MDNMKIFVVEDDAVIASAVKRSVEAWGCGCRVAQDFRAVLQEFIAYDPQLVLMDITLPFYNGYHWCSEIRKLSKVPVMFLSSASEKIDHCPVYDMLRSMHGRVFLFIMVVE